MSEPTAHAWITPDWPAPANVHAVSTTRPGGVSSGPFASLNLGTGSGDDLTRVECNRQRLQELARMPTRPVWLQQVHGTACVAATGEHENAAADATYSASAGHVCAILTADCLPVLLCNGAGDEVAAAHAGWRGLGGGILEATVAQFHSQPADLMAWLGPCIGAQRYEIDAAVYRAFVDDDAVDEEADDACHFTANRPGHWLADLAGLARARLARAGVANIHGGHWCTATDEQNFFSYRRDGTTGRMATCVWIA